MTTKKEAVLLAQNKPQPLETTTSIASGAKPVNALRELRLGREVPAQDMVDVVQAVYPGYDKTLQSKCERSHYYGVQICDGAMDTLVKTFAPDNAQERKKRKSPEVRTNPCRLVVRVSALDHNLLMDCMREEGFSTTQDWLYSHLKKYLKAKGAYK